MKSLSVFHDESYHKQMASFYGLLWIEQDSISEVVHRLQECRNYNDYHRKIHFNNLDNYKKIRMGFDWFNLSLDLLKNRMRFFVLYVNRISPAFDASRFREHFHEYNRYTAIALHSSFRWFYIRETPKIELLFYSDGKINRPGSDLDKRGDGIVSDNFEDYIQRRFQMDLEGKSHEIVNMNVIKLQTPKIPVNGRFTAEEELLQLTDLLLGASRQAFLPECTTGKCSQIKRDLGLKMNKVFKDLEKKPWEQVLGFHKRVKFNFFPGETGRMTDRRMSRSSACRKLDEFSNP